MSDPRPSLRSAAPIVSRGALLLLLVPLAGALAGCGKDREPTEDAIFERNDAYPISHILISPNERRPFSEDLERAKTALRRVRDGEAFADVARALSDDANSREAGGFIGFVPGYHETRFAGAVQMLEPGETRGTLHSQIGLHVLHRHTYEEGRELERRTSVVLHGFVIVTKEAAEGGSEHPADEARRLAEEALAKIQAKELTLAEAARVYSQQPNTRSDAFIEVVRRGPGREWIFDALTKVPEGQLVPHVVEGPQRFGVFARGRLFRSVVRQVLILHSGSEGRELNQLVTRTRDEAARIAQTALQEAKPDGSNWKIVVSKYGESGPNVSLGGTMGVVGTGDLDPRLEAVILDTPPGRVAKGILETNAGFHLLYRVD